MPATNNIINFKDFNPRSAKCIISQVQSTVTFVAFMDSSRYIGAEHCDIIKLMNIFVKINLKTCLLANTYTQFYVHLVFSPKNKDALIKKIWKDNLEKFITGIVQNNGHKLIAIGSRPDHIHIFIGYNVNQLIPDLVEKIKTSSNSWIKENRFSKFRFEWQRGYGAFSHSRSQLDRVVKYLLNQEEHHQKKSFREEYLQILRENDIKFQDEYLFEFFEGSGNWE